MQSADDEPSARNTSESSGADGIRALLGRGSLYTASTAVQLTAGLVMLPLITRTLTPADYGTVVTALVVVQVLTHLASMGLPAAISRLYYEREQTYGIGALVIIAICAAGALALLADLLAPLWAQLFADLRYGTALRIAVWMAVPLTGVASVQALLRVQDRPVAFAMVGLTAAVGGQSLGLLLVAVLDSLPELFLIGVFGGAATACAVGLVAIRSSLTTSVNGLLRPALRIGGPTVPHALAIYLINAGDRLVVERIAGLGAVGRYQIAYAIGALGLAAVSAVNNAWAPLIYRAPAQSRARTLADTTSVLLRLGGLLSAGIAIISPLALMVAAPASYAPIELTALTAITTLATLPMIHYLSAVVVLFQEKRTWCLAVITPTSAAVNLLLNVWLLPRVGLVGVGIATTASFALQAGLVRAVARRMFAFERPEGVAASWVVSLAGAALSAMLPVTGLWMGIRAAVGAGLIAAFLATLTRRLRN